MLYTTVLLLELPEKEENGSRGVSTQVDQHLTTQQSTSDHGSVHHTPVTGDEKSIDEFSLPLGEQIEITVTKD